MKRTETLKSVLLDAMIVIEVHAHKIWDNLLSKIDVQIPSVVVKDEAFFFDTKDGKNRVAIQIGQLAKSKRIIEVSAGIGEIQSLQRILDYATLQGLHAGELEALALLSSGRMEETLFCTADGAAIRALALLGLSHMGISLEKLLQRTGLQKPLDRQYREDFFQYHLNRGKQDYVTSIDLKK